MLVSWIGIGANIGDARSAFDVAWHSLEQQADLHLHSRSGIYHTRPVGLQAGGTFSNAVFSLSTNVSPLELLDRLQQVESSLGRTRNIRWGPRPIDLDLLYVDQLVQHDSRLTLPHPAAWYRRFVLDPMTEVAPDFQHPLLKQTMAQLKARLNRRPLIVACPDFAATMLTSSADHSIDGFAGVQLVPATAIIRDVSVIVRLLDDEPINPIQAAVPVADLTGSPGDAKQRIVDFLVSILDQPHRISDWQLS